MPKGTRQVKMITDAMLYYSGETKTSALLALCFSF
jgi:hypothetical protein